MKITKIIKKMNNLRIQREVNFINGQKANLSGVILAGIIPVAIFIAATVASGMFPGQKYCFLSGDGLKQFVNFSVAFMRKLFMGESLSYSFEIGMGMPTAAINAFYTINPFNVFFFLIKDAEVACLFVVCAKLMCMSMAMCLFLRTVIKSDIVVSVILSVAYGLCSCFCFFYPAFYCIDIMYITPLIALGIVRLIKTGRWGLLCLIYAYSFIIQFYFAYMAGIFSVVLFIVYSWYCNGTVVELWKKVILRFAIAVVVAIFISAPVILPAAYELYSFLASDTRKLEKFVLYPWTFLAGFYPGQSQDTHNTIPYMYVGLPVLILVTAFFIDKKKWKKAKDICGCSTDISVFMLFL